MQASSESLQGWSYLLWTLAILNLPSRACYIAGGHTNKSSLCSWKRAQPGPCSSGEERSPRFQLSPFSDQHWTQPLTMELGLSWVFLVVIFKDDLQRARNLECVSRHEWEKKCDSFLTKILCVCRYPVWGTTGGIWGRLGAAWRGSEILLCNLWIHLQ
jgi:hypothetical protein